MGEEYDHTDKKIVWDRKVAQFCLEPKKHVAEYSSGFFHEINDFHPRIMKIGRNGDIFRGNQRKL